MVIPDEWIEAGPQKDQYDIAGLNSIHISSKINEIVQSIKDYRPRKVIDLTSVNEPVKTNHIFK